MQLVFDPNLSSPKKLLIMDDNKESRDKGEKENSEPGIVPNTNVVCPQHNSIKGTNPPICFLIICHYLGDLLFLPFCHNWLCDGVTEAENYSLTMRQAL